MTGILKKQISCCYYRQYRDVVKEVHKLTETELYYYYYYYYRYYTMGISQKYIRVNTSATLNIDFVPVLGPIASITATITTIASSLLSACLLLALSQMPSVWIN